MDKKSKELLIIDLCSRLPYGFIIHRYSDNCDIAIENNGIDVFAHFLEYSEGEDFKPYLRPMSSMTEKEKSEFYGTFDPTLEEPYYRAKVNSFDWLNKYRFDYRGLIENGLALEALPGMYNSKQE